MRKKKLETEISVLFDAPEPQNKDEFLSKNTGNVHSDKGKLIFSQIKYIHKGVWILSLAVLLTFLFIIKINKEDAAFFAEITLPFVAGCGFFASVRSQFFDMSEIEASTVYSVNAIIFARMTIIGVSHLILVILLILGLYNFGVKDVLIAGLRIIIPYLATTFLCMEIAEKQEFRHNSYIYLALVFIIIGVIFIVENIDVESSSINLKTIMCLATVTLIALNIRQIKRIESEENVWNFV